jgi:hypothetical protein
MTSAVRHPKSGKKNVQRKTTAVGSASRSVVNGRTVLSVPARISGFKISKKPA